LTVQPASAAVVVNNYSGTYDGNAHGLTGSAAGVVGEDLSDLLHLGTSYTDAGTYTVGWSFDGNTDYNAAGGSGTIDIAKAASTIARATPTIAVTDAGGIYNGQPFAATATVAGVTGTAASSLEGVGLTLAYYAGSSATGTPLAGAPPHAGTYTVVAAF